MPRAAVDDVALDPVDRRVRVGQDRRHGKARDERDEQAA